MSQQTVDLPQVSLSRYLDLLKRRKWQVIPVSLIGLLIGGIVAFFIPRFYVVETLLEYHRPPGDLAGAKNVNPEDPFAAIVNNAKYTLPLAAGVTMKDLGWPESAELDPFQLRENQRAVEQRIIVIDVTPPKSQEYAQLVVNYKDRSGRRAADLLNNLVEKWRKVRLDELQRRAEAQKREANNRVQDANSAYSQISANIEELSRKYGFQRTLSVDLQRERMREAQAEQRDQLKRQEELVAKLELLDKEIQSLTAQMDRTPPYVEAADVDLSKRFPEGSEQRKDYLNLKLLQKSLEEVVGEAHPGRRALELQIARLQQKLFDKLSDSGELRNPRIAELQTAIDAKSIERSVAKKTLDVLVARIHEDEARNQERVHAETQFEDRIRDLEIAKKNQEVAQAALSQADSVLGALSIEPPITFQRVAVPQHPTDPNIVLVAGFGMLIGLGLAIALILALDVLQGTFKTVDDVERALPIRVLGGISHYETEEMQREVRTSRRRATAFAAVFLGSAVIVVTVYYVAPERLPSAALNFLSLVLGK
jgi:capsular polysaccharide biosynthesis protein